MEMQHVETSGIRFERSPDEQYCERECLELPLYANVLALVSACGSGKTKAFCRWLVEISKLFRDDPPIVVFVTHRRTLTTKAVETLPKLNDRSWISYEAIKGPIDLRQHSLVVIQYEAMGRITGYSEKNYSKVILVLDELNSILHQMHSSFANPVMAHFAFNQFCQWGKHVVAMDAYMDQERLDILERYTGRRAYLIQNTFKGRARQTFRLTRDENKTMAFVIDALEREKCVISPCFSKEVGNKLYKFAKEHFGDSKTILVYNSENRWDGVDVNIAWKCADLVIHTSTIECGLSFEVVNHFEHCVCFFDNSSGPTFETAMQMVSRSRDTSEFLVCIHTKTFPRKDDTPGGVLVDFQREFLTQQMDILFYGARACRLDNGSGSWHSCNPYIGSKAMSEVIKRRSWNNFEYWFLFLLRQEGAKIEQMIFDDKLQSKLVMTGDVQIPLSEEVQLSRLERLKLAYDCDDLDPNDQRFLKLLEQRRKLSAFKNVSMLARLGKDFESALEQKRRDIFKASAGFEQCALSGRFHPVLQGRAEVLAGVTGGCYDLNANEFARDFINAALGFSDPFNLPVQTCQELHERLGCVIVTHEEHSVLSVPKEKARKLLCLFRRWVCCSPGMHTPHRMPREDSLSFIKAMHLANHVLVTMFDLQYRRISIERKMKRGVRTCIYTYTLHESSNFTRFPNRVKGKPMLPAWSAFSPGDLRESHILAVRNDLVQPAVQFSKRQSHSYRLKSFAGIHRNDLRPVKMQKVKVSGSGEFVEGQQSNESGTGTGTPEN